MTLLEERRDRVQRRHIALEKSVHALFFLLSRVLEGGGDVEPVAAAYVGLRADAERLVEAVEAYYEALYCQGGVIALGEDEAEVRAIQGMDRVLEHMDTVFGLSEFLVSKGYVQQEQVSESTQNMS